MNSLEKLSSLLLLSAAVILNTACSLEDGTHTTADTPVDTSSFNITNELAATISAANAQDLATAGTEAIKQAANSKESSAITGSQATVVTGDSAIQSLTVSLSQQMVQQPSLVEITDPNTGASICESGILDLDPPTNTFTVVNCLILGVTLNGTLTTSAAESGNLVIRTYVFTDFNIATATNPTGTTLNIAVVCERDTTISSLSCSYQSLSTGVDGREYISSVVTITGDNNSGYSIETTVNDPTHGNVNVSTVAAVTLNCANGQPGSGEINVTDESGGSLSVRFDSCTAYTVTLNGVANSYTWP
jgi:hypothetical protein